MVNSYRYVFAASTPTVPTSGTTVDLGIGEIGVFDAKTYQATNGVTVKSIVIAQGTSSTVFPHGVAKGNFTYKTDAIKGSQVKSWKRKLGKKGSGMVTTLGYDGVDLTKTLNVKVGESFTYWMTLSGAPIANLLSDTPNTHYAVWTEEFTVQLPCAPACEETCGALVDANIVADAVLAEFGKRKMIGGQALTDYVKATKLLNCTTPSGLPTVSYTVYTLVVADNGTQADLGNLQAQYPGLVIKRKSRTGIFSTYELTNLTSVGAPADFSNAFLPVVLSCSECPSGCPTGYALQAAQDEWVVTRQVVIGDNLNTAADQIAYADAVKIAYDAEYTIVSTATFLSFNGSVASVKLYVPTGTVITPLASDFTVLLEVGVAICTQEAADLISWVACTTCTAAEKTFVISIADTCTTQVALTAELVALYGSSVLLVTHNADTCVSQYSLSVESDNKDCEACADVLWTFTTPQPFKGLVWTEVLGNHYGTGCVTGIKFESVYEQRQVKECFLTQVAYEFEPLFIALSTRNPNPNDISVLCESDVPVTVIKGVEYSVGMGRVVANQVIASNYQFNQPWRKNPAERDAFEYDLGVDLQGVYDQYILEFYTIPEDSGSVSGFGTSQHQTFELSVFYSQGTGGGYESIVTAFVASNSPLVLEDI